MAQSVSAAVKAAFSTSPIKKHYRLLIDWLTNIDQSGTITALEFNAIYFAKEQVIDDYSSVKHKPFILSTQNYLRNAADDDCLYLVCNLYENGWLGDVLSNAIGEFDEVIVDSYSESNQNASMDLYGDGNGKGQSFTGDGGTLNSVIFYLNKSGSPTGSAYAKIYAHSGTFGTSSVPTGAALATSDGVNVSGIDTDYELVTFSFSGTEKITLTNGTKYVVTVEYSGGDADNYLQTGFDNLNPTHDGNFSSLYLGTWSANSDYDLCFYVYTLAQVWQIIYDDTQQVKQITVSSSRFNYPVDFDLYYRKADDSAWLLCDNYLAVDSKTTIYEFGSQTEIKGLKIEITKISAKDMYACIVEIGLGFRDDVTGDLVDMDINKELEYETGSTNIGNISANSFSFRLQNTEQRYNSKNTDSDIYQYLKANKQVRPYIGVEESGAITYIAQGVFFIKDIIPRPEMIVEFSCVDKMALMKEKDFASSIIYEDQLISEMVTTIVEDYGLEAGEHSIDVTDDTIPYMFFNPASYAYIVKLLAVAEGGMAFFDELGIFQFKNRDWTPGVDIEKAYTASNIIKGTFDSPYIAGKMKNRVKVKSRPLYVSELKNIYTLESAVTIPAGETKSIPCYFIESPCLDVANAVVTKHADITQDSESKYNYATFLTFTNGGAADQDVTAITIEGKPLVEKGVTLADESDSTYITEYSEKVLDIDNPYIQDYSYARQLALKLLAVWRNPNPDKDYKALSMPWLQLGDRISITYPKFNLSIEQDKIVSINIKCRKSVIDTIKARTVGNVLQVKSITFVTGKGTLRYSEVIFIADGEDLETESLILEGA